MESAETTKSTAAEAAKPAAAEAAKPAAPETSSAEPPMKTATVKSPAAPGNRLVVGHHQDSGKQRDSAGLGLYAYPVLSVVPRFEVAVLNRKLVAAESASSWSTVDQVARDV